MATTTTTQIVSINIHNQPTPSLTLARSLQHKDVNELEGMSPFDLFRTQLENVVGSTEAKVDAMKRLSVVAFAMGIDDTLSTLLPYLATVAMKQNPPHEDELLINMAVELKLIVPNLLKGTQALPLLPILERLAAVEETVVRDQAVATINHVAPQLINTDSTPVLVAMAKRLVSADWFTAKVSAAGILPTLYQVTQDDELVHLIKELASDETPMVRRATAQNLGKFISYISSTTTVDDEDGEDGDKEDEGGEAETNEDGTPKEPKTKTIIEQHDGLDELVPVLTNLCNDEQDSVRLLAVASIGNVGDAFSSTQNYDYTLEVLLPLIKNGSTDLSWRVRRNLSKTFSNVAISLGIGSDNTTSPASNIHQYDKQKALVMSCFVALLQDVEAEVRAESVGHLARMVHWGGPVLFGTHLQPLLPALADDIVMEVRSKCALALMDSSEGGTLDDSVILQAFGPLLENFLQDEFSEVQLHVLSNLPKISRLLEKMNGVVSSILNMAKASNWRVREGVAKLLPHLAEARGLDFFLQVLLEPAWLALLLDGVASVRMACVAGVGKLCTVSGPDWFHTNIIPHHVRIYDNSVNSYLLRVTILQAHTETAKVCDSSSDLWQDVVRFIIDHGLTDKVPNVRMVAAKGLHEIIPLSTNSSHSYVESKIKPMLETLIQNEQDDDCRYYQDLAIQSCA